MKEIQHKKINRSANRFSLFYSSKYIELPGIPKKQTFHNTWPISERTLKSCNLTKTHVGYTCGIQMLDTHVIHVGYTCRIQILDKHVAHDGYTCRIQMLDTHVAHVGYTCYMHTCWIHMLATHVGKHY